MAVVRLITGAILIFFGRQLFWLFVGAVGFAMGFNLAARYVSGVPWLVFLIALLVGIGGVLLAIFLQKLAILAAGFVVGGYVLLQMLGLFGQETGDLTWAAFLIGGVFGALLVLALMDWALIVLSTLTGAILVIQGAAARNVSLGWPVFLVLVVLGIVVQAATMRREPSELSSHKA